MKFTLRDLTISLKRDTVLVPFADVSYFHGKMGAGKTSIARLIDYCLGGKLDPSPALQSEFVSAALRIELQHAVVTIERARDADNVIAEWTGSDGYRRISIPARKAAGIVLQGTEVANLSDLLFHLSGIIPPRVRTSKLNEDSDLRRLSLRDLLWYCYLDQDEIDSTFFHLDRKSDFKQLKSRDVLRFILRYHNERVAEIEAELEKLRGERLALTTSVTGFRRALEEVGVDSEEELLLRISGLRNEADAVVQQLDQVREEIQSEATLPRNAVDVLRDRARGLGLNIAILNVEVSELREAQERDRRHLHEVETLTLKFRRSSAAKQILQGVTFSHCPRCTQELPERTADLCQVCGQSDELATTDDADSLLVERDAKGRIEELSELILKRDRGIAALLRARERESALKARIERELGEATRVYDSVYLSRALAAERERASLYQQAAGLEALLRLPRLVAEQEAQIGHLSARESALRDDLRTERAAAQQDASSLDLLEELFHDCLLRTALPGISDNDEVKIDAKDFLPAVWGPEAIASTVTSFSNMSSGGKKTLFKSCFAVAIHRLAVRVGATLPQILIIDSPMKNISERENWEQFQGFHDMLYALKSDELRETQLVLIDKEFFPPSEDLGIDLYERHMQPNEPGTDNPNPPLIPYYAGH